MEQFPASIGPTCLDEFAQRDHELAPTEADHAAERRAFEAVSRRVARSDGQPRPMLHRHASTSVGGFDENLDLGAFLGREIGVCAS